VKKATECGQPWAFTDGHAVPAYANYFDDTEHLNKINWEAMTARYWQAVREQRQAEFLVYDWFPWDCCLKIGVANKRIAEEVLKKIAAADHKPVVTVEPTWYY
jgi:hypothetical protein